MNPKPLILESSLQASHAPLLLSLPRNRITLRRLVLQQPQLLAFKLPHLTAGGGNARGALAFLECMNAALAGEAQAYLDPLKPFLPNLFNTQTQVTNA